MNKPHSDGRKPRFSTKVIVHSMPKVLLWCGGILATIILVLFIASFFLDEPLRRYTENKLNQDLKGYSVRLSGLHFQLVGLTMTLKGLTVYQDAHPKTPVAQFPVVRADVHWREILSGTLVAEFRLDRPKVNINLLQLSTEAAGKVPPRRGCRGNSWGAVPPRLPRSSGRRKTDRISI